MFDRKIIMYMYEDILVILTFLDVTISYNLPLVLKEEKSL